MKTITPYESRRLERENHAAANEDRFPGEAALGKRQDSSAGWDPYDVWRTRVKSRHRTEPLVDPA